MNLAEDEVELARIRLVYDRAAETYQQLGADQAHYWVRARAWLEKVAHDGSTILDVGCGPGHLAADLPPSVQVIGCDISPEMIRLAALARPAGSFVVHDFHQPFPVRWPRADVTVAFGCLEFCSDLTQVARNLTAATKPEGRLLLTVPRAESVAVKREITLHPLPSVDITMRLREDAEVEVALGGAGLEVMTHRAGPGWSSPDVGTVEYGYWEATPAGRESSSTAR
jgi:SAM-dependent methyltransferase